MNTVDIKALNERIQQESSFVDMISMEMNKVIVGQKHILLMLNSVESSLPRICYRLTLSVR